MFSEHDSKYLNHLTPPFCLWGEIAKPLYTLSQNKAGIRKKLRRELQYLISILRDEIPRLHRHQLSELNSRIT